MFRFATSRLISNFFSSRYFPTAASRTFCPGSVCNTLFTTSQKAACLRDENHFFTFPNTVVIVSPVSTFSLSSASSKVIGTESTFSTLPVSPFFAIICQYSSFVGRAASDAVCVCLHPYVLPLYVTRSIYDVLFTYSVPAVQTPAIRIDTP